MSIKRLLIVAGALALSGCFLESTGPALCQYPGHGDELDQSVCILPDELPISPVEAEVTAEEPEESP